MKRVLMVVFILLFIMIGLTGFADTEANALRLGISYGSTAKADWGVDFTSGFTPSRYRGGQIQPLGMAVGESHLQFKRNDTYIVVSQLGFATIDEANVLFNTRGLVPAGYYYNELIRPIFAVLATRQEAESYLSQLSASNPDLSASIMDPSGSQVKATGLTTQYIYTDIDPLVMMDASSDPYYAIAGRTYRGGVSIQGLGSPAGLLNHINVQRVETYLYGVLPKEMGYNWPLEALKAQAVAARNYANKNLNKHVKTNGFDLCTTTHCQVYGGVESEKSECNQAVDATAGRLIYYGDQLVEAYYHSNSGGVTENSENVWSAFLGYIRGIVDVYSLDAPNTDWMLSFTREELQALFLKAGFDTGTIYDLRIDKRTETGRVYSVVVVGSKGSFTFEKEKFRTAIGSTKLKSMLFEIQKGDKMSVLTQNGQEALTSGTVYAISAKGIHEVKIPLAAYNGEQTLMRTMGLKDFTFVGKGYGHGLGMSQYGAKKMAELGYDYVAILSYYYKDVNIR